MLIATFSFAKWVMIEGQHHINDTKAMYMYNDETGAMYIGEPKYAHNKDGKPYPAFMGFQEVHFIHNKEIKGKTENHYESYPRP